jgi:Na+-driven multidrug efflux pump
MKLCIDVIVLFIFSINGGILRALGLQWHMALSIFVVLWCGALPVMYHYSVVKGGGLDSLWTLLPCFYAILDVVTFLCYYTADWHAISKGINERDRKSALLDEVPDESTYLISRERAESIGRESQRSIA